MKNILFTTVLIILTACGGSDGDNANDSSDNDAFDYSALLTNIADNIIMPNYQAFAVNADSLKTSTDNFCLAIGAVSEASALSTAQTDWRAAMQVWQQAELHILGPVSDNDNALRNRILYFVEGDYFSETNTDAAISSVTDSVSYTASAANTKGLLALEYILFSLTPSASNCAYAQLIIEDIRAAIISINDAWLTSGGNFRSSFINPATVGDRINLLSDGLFYLDKEIKDLRLGLPLDVNDACAAGYNCADDVESVYSNNSLENILNNLIAFRNIFTGANGLGFDDIYLNQDMASLSTDFIADINAAISQVQTLVDNSTNLSSAAAAIVSVTERTACDNAIANPEVASSYPACNLYGLIKRIDTKLKTEFITIVGSDIPDRAQGDND